jgi:hypothetical protein
VKPGDRVTTPHGPATITAIQEDATWVFGRPERTTWIVFQCDHETRLRREPTRDIELLEEALEPWPAPDG